MEHTWRALSRDDVPQAAALVNLLATADGTGEVVTEAALLEDLQAPQFDPATDTLSVWDGDELVGMGSVQVRDAAVEDRAMVMFFGGIHPDHRGQGLGSALLARLEARGVALAAERLPGLPVRLRSSGGLADSSAQRLLELSGYAPDNYFVTMQIELADWEDPGARTVARPPTADLVAAIRHAHNDAFRDHRNFSPVSAAHWAHWTGSSTARPDLSQVVVEDGQVVAYALASSYEPEVVHVDLVGTRRSVRGRGLGRDVLVAGLRAAASAGLRTSELEVDSTSPTSADRLYLAAGYRPVRVISRYIRDVPAR